MAAHRRVQLEQDTICWKAQIKQEAAHVSLKKVEMKAKFNLLEAQKEASAIEAEACILNYDESKAFGNLPDEKKRLAPMCG